MHTASDNLTQTTTAQGRLGEQLVVQFLSNNDYQIVGTNLRVGPLEIDIVAQQADTLVVVEVRTRGRSSWTKALGSIDSRKRRLIRCAGSRLWRRQFRNDPTVTRMRFDAASVDLTNRVPIIHYVKAAF